MSDYEIIFLNRAGLKQSPQGKFLWYKGWVYVDRENLKIYIGRYLTILKDHKKDEIQYIGGIYTMNIERSKTIQAFLEEIKQKGDH